MRRIWNRLLGEPCEHEHKIVVTSVGVQRSVCEACGHISFVMVPSSPAGAGSRTAFAPRSIRTLNELRHDDGLGVEEFLHPDVGELAPVSAHLDTAERQSGIRCDEGVHEARSGLDPVASQLLTEVEI